MIGEDVKITCRLLLYLKLAKDYSKKRHLDLLPHGNNNILENLEFIYDENWENQGVPYPYEILTYIRFFSRSCSRYLK